MLFIMKPITVLAFLCSIFSIMDEVQAGSLFSHRDCEFKVNLPGKMQPLNKQTAVGPVYGGMSVLKIRGINRQLVFQVECQKMPRDMYSEPNATDVTLNTLTQLNMKVGATNTSYDVEKTTFSVRGVSRGLVRRFSAETIMRTEMHVGRRSLLTLRVIAHKSDVDKIIANEFLQSVSR